MPVIQGLYTGVPYEIYDLGDATDITNLDTTLNTLVDNKQEDTVVSIVLMPTWMARNQAAPMSADFTVSRGGAIAGYMPRNKKLFSYPYQFLCCDCLTETHIYKYERFTYAEGSAVCPFVVVGCMSTNPELMIAPKNYNGSAGGPNAGTNFTEKVTMTGWPQCAFTVDAFRAWLAQKATGEGISVAAGLAGAIAGLIAAPETGGSSLGITVAALGSMATQVNNSIQEATKGSTTRGNIGSSVVVACGGQRVYMKKMGVTREYAEIIDDYFDRYGYACNRIKVPGRANRPYWTYVKTNRCTIKGGVPANYAKKICDIYDAGITWWREPSHFGDYTQDNRPS